MPHRSRLAGQCAALLLGVVPCLVYAESLYERIGGMATLQAVSSRMIDRTAADPRLGRSFDKVDLQRVKDLIAEQFCELSGGPCTYSGDDMRDVHAGLQITQSEFYGLVEHLELALQELGVGLREKNELLALLAPMKRDVIER